MSATIMRIKAVFLGAALACSLPWSSSASATLPDPITLLDNILEPPKIPYQGHLMVTHWYGRQAQAYEVTVSFVPPNNYRWEFLAPDGTPERIVKSDGDREEMELVRTHRRFLGDPIKNYEKLMGEDKEKELLLRNYDLAVAEPESLAGRQCWILEIIPKEKDKHRQRVWIDQQTGVVLQIRRFRPEGRFTILSRFISFAPQKNLSNDLFSLDRSSGTAAEHGLDPLSVSLDEFKKIYGQSFDPPMELPAGFVFESANHFKIRNREIWHLRYTDGLGTLSLFLTPGPVSLPKNGQLLGDASIAGVGQPVMYGFGKVLKWKKHGRNYVLIGDLSRGWLEKIAAKIP